jgi:uncharacterized membrane protein (DUF373 family)
VANSHIPCFYIYYSIILLSKAKKMEVPKMAIESIVALGLVTLFLGVLTWYISHHRSEDENNSHPTHEKHHDSVTNA